MHQDQITHYKINISHLKSMIERGKDGRRIRLSTQDHKALSTAIDHNEEKLNGGE